MLGPLQVFRGGRPVALPASRKVRALLAYMALAPKSVDVILNTAFKLFPESAAAQGKKREDEEVSAEGVAFAHLMRGVHW